MGISFVCPSIFAISLGKVPVRNMAGALPIGDRMAIYHGLIACVPVCKAIRFCMSIAEPKLAYVPISQRFVAVAGATLRHMFGGTGAVLVSTSHWFV
jgi:hypothetical protein